jgi:c-di-GMP-related signal transduction protein
MNNEKTEEKIKISFNLRVGYNEANDCIREIEKLGGEGYITVGGSWYMGTKEQIEQLISYMDKMQYDLGSMEINQYPAEATKKRVEHLVKNGIVKIGKKKEFTK